MNKLVLLLIIIVVFKFFQGILGGIAPLILGTVGLFLVIKILFKAGTGKTKFGRSNSDYDDYL